MNFAAVILAGGKSSRMGRDKAWIEISGQPLIARQIQRVRQAGAQSVFISGQSGVDYSTLGCPVLHDDFPAGGPLAGIVSALKAIREPLLLVLAVDMLHMSSQFLRGLHAHCQNGMGIVPRREETVEPLAAFYLRASLELVPRLLQAAEPDNMPGPKAFASECVRAGLAKFLRISPMENQFFNNCNSPADLPA